MSSADNITITVVIVDVKRDNFTEWIISALVNEFRMDCGEDTVQSEIHIIKNVGHKDDRKESASTSENTHSLNGQNRSTPISAANPAIVVP